MSRHWPEGTGKISITIVDSQSETETGWPPETSLAHYIWANLPDHSLLTFIFVVRAMKEMCITCDDTFSFVRGFEYRKTPSPRIKFFAVGLIWFKITGSNELLTKGEQIYFGWPRMRVGRGVHVNTKKGLQNAWQDQLVTMPLKFTVHLFIRTRSQENSVTGVCFSVGAWSFSSPSHLHLFWVSPSPCPVGIGAIFPEE